MKNFILKLVSVGVLVSSISFLTGGLASAHVFVKPAEVLTAGYQIFVVAVPNEKDIATTSIKLEIPLGLKSVMPTQKEGWSIDVEKDSSGEDATVNSITWSGNEINEGFRDEFTFSAQAPAQETELNWKVYQTYSDASVVSWDQTPTPEAETSNTDEESETSGPYSVTKVVSTLEPASLTTQKLVADTETTASRAVYIGISGVVIGLVAIFFSTRKI